MNELQTAALAAVLVASAVAATVHALRPQRRSIADVRALLYTATRERPGSGGAVRGDGRAWSGSAFAPYASRVEQRLGPGLRLLAQTPSDVLSRIVVASAAGFGAVVLSVGSLAAIGALSPNPMWLAIALAVGAGSAWIMWSDVQQKIARRRREFQRAANDFVQLIALGLTTDQSVEEAIAFALDVGGGSDDPEDVWEIIRRDVSTAPQRGVPLWEALDGLGATYEQRELSELATSIERQGTQGVSITETVNTLAASMRAKALDDLEREADKVNANLAGPTVGFVVTMIVFLAYPLALRITEAFGG